MTTTETTTSQTSTVETAAGAAEWFERVHVEQLLDNPTDVRGGDRDQTGVVEMAASIREAGLLQALTVIPVPDDHGGQDSGDASCDTDAHADADEVGQRLPRFVVYAGHRRRDGARLAAAQVIAEALGYHVADDPTLADLEVDPDDPEVRVAVGAQACAAADRLRHVPCLVRPDLAATIGMDIAAGLIENDQRVAITGGQRARAAEQLSMADGWNITRITAATGLSRANARAAAALPHLGDTAREAVYRGELSLEHVAVLDTLAELGATADELGLLARSTSMFDHHVAELRKTLTRRSAAAGLLDDVDAQGWTRYEVPESYPLDSPLAPLWSLTRDHDPDGERLLPRHGEHANPLLDPTAASYAALPDHGVVLINDPWEDPYLEVVCADPETAGYGRDPRSTLYQAPEPATPEPITPDTGSLPAPDEGPEHTDGFAADEDTEPTDVDRDQDLDGGVDGGVDSGVDGGAEAGVDEGLDGGLDEQAREAARVEAERLAEQRRLEAERLAEQRRLEAERLAEQRRVEAAERAAENERRETERAAERARRDALATAASTRWAHVVGMLRTQKAAAAHTELLAVVLARFPWLLGGAEDLADRDQVRAVVAAPDRDPATGVARWSDGRVTHRAVVTAAAILEDNLAGTAQLSRATIEHEEAEPALWWLDYLTTRGYQLAEVETATRDDLAATLAERLADEFGTAPEPEQVSEAAPEGV